MKSKCWPTLESKSYAFPMLLIWLIAVLAVPYQFVLQSTPNVMIPTLMHDLQISELSIGFLTSSFFYTYLLFQVPAGLLIDRFGVRVVLSGSIFLAALACLIFACASHVSQACLSRLLMGLVTAPCVPAVMSIAANRFPLRQFVILAGISESIGMFGGSVGSALLGYIVGHFGWRGTMVGCASVGLLLAVLMYVFIRDSAKTAYTSPTSVEKVLNLIPRGGLHPFGHRPRDFSRGVSKGERAFAPLWSPSARVSRAGEIHTGNKNTPPLGAGIFIGFLVVLKNPQIWLIVFYAGFIFALLPALAGLWVVQALQDLYGLDVGIAALGSSMLFLGTAVGLPFWGWCSERIRRRKPVMLAGTVLCTFFSACFIYLTGLPLSVMFILLLLMGFSSAVYVLAFALVREQTAPNVRASAMGLTNMMSMIIGAPLLQPIIGLMLKGVTAQGGVDTAVRSTYHAAMSSIMVCLVLAMVLTFFIRETYCQEQTEFNPILVGESSL